ncbi:hypothetical protein B0T17DRAFT_619996 [Bombardia bombarda]|uniref:Uncharacterized protein n=1 Tax=Bombardia bombarda TaxID=252184 RepID=A0AA39WH12_9PEZI|nr:hypothetical protein B0T17DRAFT_619996 [Bombardia bombarda]
MPRAAVASDSSIGARVLSEIDEGSLDEILTALRTIFAAASNNANTNSEYRNAPFALPPIATRLNYFPIARLNELVTRHFRSTQSAPLAISGRYYELLYVLVATLIASPHSKAISIIDFEGRFDPLRLLTTSPFEEVATANRPQPKPFLRRADLDHVHILRPVRGSAAHIASCVASVEQYMLYGTHPSRGREWWGTVVIGGGLNPAGSVSAATSAQVAVTADWKGWLRVERAEIRPFGGVGVEQALADRDRRQAAVDNVSWVASSPWGSFPFRRQAPLR